jgi:hypothetical protein
MEITNYLKHINFQKKLVCLCLIIRSLLSVNKNIWLVINDISFNTKNFNCVYHFAQASHLSSLSGLKFIDQFF